MGNWCEKCGEFMFGKHSCPPLYVCLIDDYDVEGDEREVYAKSAMEAAEKVAEIYDSEEYSMLDGEEIVVIVKNGGISKEFVAELSKKFRVRGRAVPDYYAEEVKEKD